MVKSSSNSMVDRIIESVLGKQLMNMGLADEGVSRRVAIEKQRSKNSGGSRRHGKDRKSREARSSHKKLKDRESTLREVFPSYDGPVATDFDTERIYGVILPPGHGKTWYAEHNGWIDVDSLVPERSRVEMLERVYEEVSLGVSFEEAMRPFNTRCLQSLRMLAPGGPTLLLASSMHLLESSNVKCVVKLLLDDEAFEDNIRGREPHEQALARIIHKGYKDMPDNANVVSVHDNKQMAEVLLHVADALQVPLGAPKIIGKNMDLPGAVGSDSRADIDTVIDLYNRGLVWRAIVDHQISLNGMKSYRGFGFTLNDWAKVAGQVVEFSGDHNIPEPMGEWPVTLGKLSQTFDLTDDRDAQALLQAHKDEPEAFVTTVLLHWKMYGRKLPINGRTFFLYCTRFSRWDTVMRRVRSGVLSSGTYMGDPLSLDERELLLSLHILSCTSRNALRTRLHADHFGYPNNGPSTKLRAGLAGISRRIEYKKRIPNSGSTIHKLMADSPTQEVKDIANGLEGLGTLRRQDLVAYLLGCYASEDWCDEKGWQATISLMLRHIALNWYTLGRIRDEWHQFIRGVLQEECDTDDQLAYCVARMVCRPTSEGLSGSEWSSRVADALQQLIITGWVGECLNRPVALCETGGVTTARVIGASDEDIWCQILKSGAPKFMLSWLAPGCSTLQMTSELVDWSSSPTGFILELVNAGRWLGNANQKDRVGLLINWLKRNRAEFDQDLLAVIIGLYTKKWLKRRFTPKLAEELNLLGEISRQDGGYALYESKIGRVEVDRNNTWTGRHGSVKVTKGSKSRSKKLKEIGSVSALEVSLESSRDLIITSGGIALVGALAVCCLSPPSKEEANRAYCMLARLERERPRYSDRHAQWHNLIETVNDMLDTSQQQSG